jgi:hypothetical protein
MTVFENVFQYIGKTLKLIMCLLRVTMYICFCIQSLEIILYLVRECVSNFKGRVDIKPWRNERNQLNYIEDHVYFNCPIDRLSFYYSRMHLVKSSVRVGFRNPIVMQHHNKRCFSHKLYSEVVTYKLRVKESFRLIDRNSIKALSSLYFVFSSFSPVKIYFLFPRHKFKRAGQRRRTCVSPERVKNEVFYTNFCCCKLTNTQVSRKKIQHR